MEHSSNMLYYHSALPDPLNMENNYLDPDLAAAFDKQSDPSMFMKRSPLSKAERRAEHNAIERARRESLNGKFQQLAESLPNLQNYRRPSKGQIVEKALDWVRQSVSKEDRYQYQIVQLQNENKQLMMQLNLRQQEAKLLPPQMVGNCEPRQNLYHYQQVMNQVSQESTTTSLTLPPQLTSSPYSTATDSRRGSSFMDDDDDRGDLSSMDTYSFSTMLPGSTLPPDMCFYNGLPSPMDPSSWEKLNALTTPTLVHPTDLSF